ncbi:unnamed protein product [Timema podura]|uniref:Uncharacterized protein n=1 Tax=Timema podura TaxID=61482 RepID=A0ABN7P205_TIMPD|nr:unnamed protein product [Timema podura]
MLHFKGEKNTLSIDRNLKPGLPFTSKPDLTFSQGAYRCRPEDDATGKFNGAGLTLIYSGHLSPRSFGVILTSGGWRIGFKEGKEIY